MSEYNFVQKQLSVYGGFYREQRCSFDVFCKEVANNKNISVS